jgi:hypothetical protein
MNIKDVIDMANARSEPGWEDLFEEEFPPPHEFDEPVIPRLKYKEGFLNAINKGHVEDGEGSDSEGYGRQVWEDETDSSYD